MFRTKSYNLVIDSSHFSAGLVLKGDKVDRTAPILSYMQGWSAKPPVESPMTQANQTAWTFGTPKQAFEQAQQVTMAGQQQISLFTKTNTDALTAGSPVERTPFITQAS